MNNFPHTPSSLRNILLAGIGSLAMLAVAQPAAADMFRWVGKNGQTHYGDTLPPGQSSHGYEIINPATGEVIQTIKPPKTAAQLAAEAAAKKAKEERKASEEAQRRQDQVLLDLYSSVADIKRARDTRLTDIDRQISQLEGAIKRADKRAKDKSLPKSTREDAKKNARQMEQNIAQLNDTRDAVVLKFDKTIKRFQQIKSADAASAAN